jgi:hypothetical protein
MKDLEARFESSRHYLENYYGGMSILSRDYANKYYTAMFYKVKLKSDKELIVPSTRVKLVYDYDIDAEPVFKNGKIIANSIYELDELILSFKIKVKVLGKLIRVYIIE